MNFRLDARTVRGALGIAAAVFLTACSATSTSAPGMGQQSFAFAGIQAAPVTPPAQAEQKSAAQDNTSARKEAEKRKIAEAKRRLENERKRLLAFETMTQSLGEAQKAMLKPQRDRLQGQVDAAETALGKLEAAARPRIAGARYHDIIARHAAANGVPLKLAHAVVRVESNYRANARGKAGEIGLMQLKLSTARLLGYRGSASALYDPETNIRYGMKYLGEAHRLSGGSTCGTILKYNAGHGAKRMNPISARYCSKVKRII